MKNRSCCAFLILSCLILTTPFIMAAPEVITDFKKGMELTGTELETVLSLAQKSGVTNVVKVSTGYISHTPERGIFVVEREFISSGKARHRELFIKSRKWLRDAERRSERPAPLDEFWIANTYTIELTILQVDEREFRFSLAENVSIDTAKTILEILLKDDYSIKDPAAQTAIKNEQPETEDALTLLNKTALWTPIELGYDSSEETYYLRFKEDTKKGPSYYLSFSYKTGRIELLDSSSIQM